MKETVELRIRAPRYDVAGVLGLLSVGGHTAAAAARNGAPLEVATYIVDEAATFDETLEHFEGAKELVQEGGSVPPTPARFDVDVVEVDDTDD